MHRIRFQNGPEAPEIFLTEETETREEAELRLPTLARQYGTVPEAIAWVDGDEKPDGAWGSKAPGEPEPELEPEATQHPGPPAEEPSAEEPTPKPKSKKTAAADTGEPAAAE